MTAEASVDFSDFFSTIEKLMMENLLRIEIIRKKGRGVPVLLRPVHVEALNLMLRYGEEMGIPSSNDFLVARPSSTSENPLDACKYVRILPEMAEVKLPQAMKSTLLRKHIATVSQLYSLTPQELQQIAIFLAVHMDYYRLPGDILQITKHGRLLIDAEEGKFPSKHVTLRKPPSDTKGIL